MFNSEFLKISFFVCIVALIEEVHSTWEETRLIQHLLKDYDTLSRPVKSTNVPLNLEIGLNFLQIVDVSEKQQIITTNLLLSLQWNDTNLSWDPSEYGNITMVRIPYDQLWKPDIKLYNTASERCNCPEDIRCLAYNSSTVVYVQPLILRSTCKMDVTWFPFDEQKCEMLFGSWTHSGFEIDLQLRKSEYYDTVDLSHYVGHGEWLLLGVESKRNVVIYPCCPNEPYINVAFTIHIKRRSFYYFFNLIVPCGLIGFLALLGFTLPPDSVEKLTLGVTILFSLIVFLNMISGSMPANSDAVPLIGTYFNCVMFMIASCVVPTTVINLKLKSLQIKEITGHPKKLFFYWLPRIFRLNLPLALEERHSDGFNLALTKKEDSQPNEPARNFQDEQSKYQNNFLDFDQKIIEERIKLQWKFVAFVVDRICFFVSIAFSIVAAIVFLVSAL